MSIFLRLKILSLLNFGLNKNINITEKIKKVTNYQHSALNLHNLFATHCSCSQELGKHSLQKFSHSKSRQIYQQNTKPDYGFYSQRAQNSDQTNKNRQTWLYQTWLLQLHSKIKGILKCSLCPGHWGLLCKPPCRYARRPKSPNLGSNKQ